MGTREGHSTGLLPDLGCWGGGGVGGYEDAGEASALSDSGTHTLADDPCSGQATSSPPASPLW